MQDASLDKQDNADTGVFVGIALDLNSTNFSLRWGLSARLEELEHKLGRQLNPQEREEWRKKLCDAAGPALNANRTMGALGSVVASRVAREFRIGGPSFTISSEENSGLRALETALRLLQKGELNSALVGAVDLAGDLRSVLGRHRIHPCSSNGSAPFDALADGVTVGEGACAVVLKRLADAVRDGDRIYGVIRGMGSSSGNGAECNQLALKRAYLDSGVSPSTIDFVESGADGSPTEDRKEANQLQLFFEPAGSPERSCALGTLAGDIGQSGAAAGLASLVRCCLALYHEIIPGCRGLQTPCPELNSNGSLFLPNGSRYWLRNRADGPRRAAVNMHSVDGSCCHVVLEGYEGSSAYDDNTALKPTGFGAEFLFAVSADSPAELKSELDKLQQKFLDYKGSFASFCRDTWSSGYRINNSHKLALAMVARDSADLEELIRLGNARIAGAANSSDTDTLPALRDRLFYTADPLGSQGEVAFVFPGSGSHFAGMGMELLGRWPQILHRQDSENLYLRKQFQPERFWNGPPGENVSDNHRAVIFGQVATGCGVSDLVRAFGVSPSHAIGYSLGESAALFSQRAWLDRDGMYTRMQESTLFTHDLAGECRAACKAWGLPDDATVNWSLGVVDAPETEVRRPLPRFPHTYLLIVNTPDECVIGGDSAAVNELVTELGCRFFPLQGVTTVHCEVAAQVAQPYHDLHLFPTNPPAGVTFYSGVKGDSYLVTRESAAESILGQALHGLNYPAVIESAYAAGARLFLEMGPGASCSRMIGRILGDRPHLARSACYGGQDPQSTLLRLLGSLIAERVPVDLAPLFKTERNADTSSSATVRVAIGGAPFQPPRPPAILHQQNQETPPPNLPLERGGMNFVQSHPPTDALLQQFAVAQDQQIMAHEAFLSFSNSITQSLAQAMVLEMQLRQALGDQVAILEDLPPFQGEGRGGDGLPIGTATSTTTHPSPSLPLERGGTKIAFNRDMCLEFAIGSVARMLGQDFAEADSFPTRVRLPDEPLMLVDRIISIEGEARSMKNGRVITEHDIHPGAWYLDGGRIPTCIAVEAGQADLFLSGYLGIDFITRGLAVYRLLDAVVTFHRGLPGPGETIHYDIRIERFFRQGDTWLFRFFFEASVNGEALLSMRDGCAGFFSQQELDAGKGIVRPAIDLRPTVGKRPANWQDLVPMGREHYDATQLDRLRDGDLAGCFGPLFKNLPLSRSLTIPGGQMRLVHRVMKVDPTGGRCQSGFIRAEADIHPDDWFITCHFVDDRVMPGTLMYECCMHTLRIYLLRMGWVAEAAEAVWEPLPGVASKLCCRGQVLESTRVVTYEVTIRELGYGPEPFVICDALMYADGKPIVEITSMSARLTGTTREKLTAMWSRRTSTHPPPNLPLEGGGTYLPPFMPQRVLQGEGRGGDGYCYTPKPAIYTKQQILAYSNGKPSEGFGERYNIFDNQRKIARLPGPPFQFMDRVTALRGEPWQMTAGALAEAQYDLPADAWFFAVERQPRMPFAVLLEAALQPCGWLAAYVGSALTSPTDISFRNLGGTAIQHRGVTPDSGVLTCTATMKKVATSGGMIIQEFDFSVADRHGILYEGDTMFGFFSKEALNNQVGIRDAKPYLPSAAEVKRSRNLPFPTEAPFPDKQLRMIDHIELFVTDGGPAGLGYLRGIKDVDPDEWFFQAHFYEDPVTPGSLGLESFLQLVKFAVVERWGWNEGDILETVALGRKHSWLYRGQVVPTNKRVTVEAWITAADDDMHILTAAGFLSVDGKTIYQMNEFTVRLESQR
jgi:acyl transferase domain-containing protein/3-hydroxymyristoyl/3-hydroxydecanoyl-(acyl carrier protein) dehydratase